MTSLSLKFDDNLLSPASSSPDMSKTDLPVGESPQYEYVQRYRRWSDLKHRYRKPMAEFFGTMILLLMGTAVDCQVTLSTNAGVAGVPKGGFLSVCMGWGAGAAFGIWASMGISGGHINPAVTLVQVLFRRFNVKEALGYIVAQVAGAFVGAFIVYGTYYQAIDVYEGGAGIRTVPGTASLFITFPSTYLNAASCFFSEFIITAMLLIIVLSVTDKNNTGAPPAKFVPLIIFVAVTTLSASLAMQTGGAMNPARDLGPRLMTAIFYGRKVWSYRNHFWLWTPILGDLAGAIVGAAVYDTFLYTGEDSRLNTRRVTSTLHPRRWDTTETRVNEVV